jgi:hypothetical protein
VREDDSIYFVSVRSVDGLYSLLTGYDYHDEPIESAKDYLPGKMPLQDLASFIQEQRAQMNQTIADAAAGASTNEEQEMRDMEDGSQQQKFLLRFDMKYRELET